MNVAGGNLLITKPLPGTVGRGFDISPALSYNSQDVISHDGATAGRVADGWTFGLTGLEASDSITSFTGASLEPLVATSTTVALRDDDGTQHVFTAPASGIYTSPAGTWLRVRDISVTGEAAPSWAPDARFAATRPDRVTFWYAAHDPAQLPAKDGRLLGISDRNGAALATGSQVRFAYECVARDTSTGDTTLVGAGDCSGYTAPGGTTLQHRMAAVLDDAGRSMDLDYYDDVAGATANRDGYLKSVNDIAGVTHEVTYDRLSSDRATKPRVLQIKEAVGAPVARATSFEYVASDDAATRWLDESNLVSAVVDPRGARTKFRYEIVDGERLARVTAITDRVDSAGANDMTTLTYDVADGATGGETRVRDESRQGFTYSWDSLGRVTRSVTPSGLRFRNVHNAQNKVTSVQRVLAEDEARTLTGTTPAILSETVIDTGTEVIVRSAPNQLGTRYTAGTDYVLGLTPGTLVRSGGSTIPSGSTVYITYVYSSTSATWDAKTGFPLSSAAPAPMRVDSGGTRIAPTAGELASPTVNTYTNVALDGYVADLATTTTPRGTTTAGDPDDFQTTYTYDSNLRPVQISEPINAATGAAGDLAVRSFAYAANGDTISTTDSKGVTSGYSDFDDGGQARRSHKAIVGTFDPETVPVETVTSYDTRGNATCVDSKLETGDSEEIPACQGADANLVYETSTYDELGRLTIGTDAWRAPDPATSTPARRRASRTTYDANGNATAVVNGIGYTLGVSNATSPDSGTAGVTTTTTFDSLDRAIGTVLPSNDTSGTARITLTEYTKFDQVYREVTPKGVASPGFLDYTTWHYYDVDGREVRTMNGNGEVTCRWYGRLGRLAQVSQPMALASGVQQCPTSAPSSYVESYAYDRVDNVVDNYGVTGRVTKSYTDAEANTVRQEDAAGAATKMVSDPSGEALQVIAPAVSVCTDPTTCATKATVAATAKSTYDGEGEVAATTDAREGVEGEAAGSHTTTFDYTVDGDLKTISLPAAPGEAQSYQHTEYTALGDVATTSTQTGDATPAAVAANEQATWQLAPDGSVAGKTDAATGTGYSVTYHVNGQMQSRTEHGVTRSWSYYDDGSIASEMRTALRMPFEGGRTYAVGECVIPTTPGGTTYLVTNAGMAASTEPTWPGTGSVNSGTADPVTFTADSCNTTIDYTYDLDGQERTVTQTSGAGVLKSEVRRRDNMGRVLDMLALNDPSTTADDEKAATTTSYDLNGNVVWQIQNGRKTTYTYGTSGSTTGLVTAEQLGYLGAAPEMSANFEYDTAGRLSAIIRNAKVPVRTDMRYDAAGNMTRMVSCELATACIDGAGARLTTAVVQDTRYDFDAVGNIRVKADYRRQAAAKAFTADTDVVAGALYRSSTNAAIQFTADTSGKTGPVEPAWSSLAVGQTITSGDVSFRRVAEAGAVTWGAFMTVTKGAVVQPTVPNGHQYLVVSGGQLEESEPTWPAAEGATFAEGSATLREFTTTTKYAYDAQNRMEFEDRDDDPTTIQDFARKYVYDANGRLDKVLNADCTSGSDVAEQYTYETGATEQSAQLDKRTLYEFSSAAGVCVSNEKVTTDVEFGAQGSNQAGSIAAVETKNTAGAVVKTVEFEHAADNLLAAATVNGVTAVTTRDAEGRPIKETTPDGLDAGTQVDTAEATYADGDRNAATLKETGDIEARGKLVAPNGWLIAEHRDPSGYDRYFITDHLGTPTIEYGRSGTELATNDYDAYGELDPLKSSGDMSTTTGFAGERVDPTTGLTDHDARSYDPSLKTWITTDQYSDPSQDIDLALDPATSNRTLYAGGDPINNLDEDGHRHNSSTDDTQCRNGTCVAQTVGAGSHSPSEQQGSVNPVSAPMTATNLEPSYGVVIPSIRIGVLSNAARLARRESKQLLKNIVGRSGSKAIMRLIDKRGGSKSFEKLSKPNQYQTFVNGGKRRAMGDALKLGKKMGAKTVKMSGCTGSAGNFACKKAIITLKRGGRIVVSKDSGKGYSMRVIKGKSTLKIRYRG